MPKGESALTSEQNRMMDNEQNRIASINDGQVVNLNEKIKKRRFKKKKGGNSVIGESKLSSDIGDIRDRTMKTIKFQNTIIRVLGCDLKSKKNLIGKNAEIIYLNQKNGRYIGKIQNGIPHGFGVKTWPDGKKY